MHWYHWLFLVKYSIYLIVYCKCWIKLCETFLFNKVKMDSVWRYCLDPQAQQYWYHQVASVPSGPAFEMKLIEWWDSRQALFKIQIKCCVWWWYCIWLLFLRKTFLCHCQKSQFFVNDYTPISKRVWNMWNVKHSPIWYVMYSESIK